MGRSTDLRGPPEQAEGHRSADASSRPSTGRHVEGPRGAGIGPVRYQYDRHPSNARSEYSHFVCDFATVLFTL